jgi:hypothetical protein
MAAHVNLGAFDVLSPNPNTLPLRGPNGEIKAGPPGAPEDAVNLAALSVTEHFASGNLIDLAADTMLSGLLYQVPSLIAGGPPQAGGPGRNWRCRVVRTNELGRELFVWNAKLGVWGNIRNVLGVWGDWKRLDAGGAFPSGRALNLSVPASGGKVIAPGDGYLTLSGTASDPSNWLRLFTNNVGTNRHNAPVGIYSEIFVPAAKDAEITVEYGGMRIDAFRFTQAICSM